MNTSGNPGRQPHGAQSSRVYVRPVPHDEPDLAKLARALIALAQAQQRQEEAEALKATMATTSEEQPA